MRVLFADRVPDWFPERLEASGTTVRVEPTLERETLTEVLAAFQPQVLVVRSTRVQQEQLEASPELKLVIRAGAGVNTIDVDGARERRIHVANCPGMNASAVAELAIGHLINLDRRISDNVADIREGRWAKKTYARSAGLRTRTLGLLGIGNIGQLAARIARAMGMEIAFWDPFVEEADVADLEARKVETPEALAEISDAVTVHLAEVPATRNLVGSSFFAAMKPGALFVNTSRSGIVERNALLQAIDDKGIRAGIDVWWDEPDANAREFADIAGKNPNIYGTHHIGASTQQAQDAVAHEAFRVLQTFRDEGQVLNQVNPW